ncbi:MAG TPA: NAD(P)/FAD-dependent oxidoreductase [Thermoanaerobaculia bacterium]|nr:NAD(P)/FAD-dependent oxidoreductase [Thermoanaerobaculia bacterium]
MSRIAVIGGGPAGLGLAHELVGAGHQVTLFEAAAELGGLARSFELGPIRIERYYHFLCADDHGYFRKLAELGLGERLRWQPTRMGFFYHGRLYPFSSPLDLLRFSGISLASRLRYGAAVLYCSRIRDWRRLDGRAAEPWLIRLLGREGYVATWLPLLQVKFNQHHPEISAAWVWHRIFRVARSRKTPFHGERLGHLVGGSDTLIDALEADLQRRGAELRRSRPVARLRVENGAVRGLTLADGSAQDFDRVAVAAPLPQFLRLAGDALPRAYRQGLEAIEFLGVVCVVLRLRTSISENYWLNVNDPAIAWNGCIEYTRLNPEATPDGSTILYIPFYLPRDHPRFAQPHDELIEECLADLGRIRPGLDRSALIDAAVSRDPYAQVVCPAGFADQVPHHRTPVAGLYLVESSQLYPSDRTISGTLDLAAATARVIAEDEASALRQG